jgi:hypothetical protein
MPRKVKSRERPTRERRRSHEEVVLRYYAYPNKSAAIRELAIELPRRQIARSGAVMESRYRSD